MNRRRRPILLLTALLATAIPRGSASASCVSTLPVPTDKRLAGIRCAGVRPGMSMLIPSKKHGEYACAAGFAFADQFGGRYLSFPGNCYLDYRCVEDTVYETLPPPLDKLVPRVPTCVILEGSDEEPYYKGNGPIVRDANGVRIGRVAYAIFKGGVDFALVKLDPKVRLDPSLPLYGGPTAPGQPRIAEDVYVVSPGDRTGPNARVGVFYGSLDFGAVVTEGMTTRAPGSPVMMTNGGALGMFTGYLSITGWETQTNGPGLAQASDRTRLRFRLLTAPLT